MNSPRKASIQNSKFDLDSPRFIAAMKVTGIEASDLAEPKPPQGGGGEAQSEAAQRRFEMMDRKRRQLMRELDETAAALDETLVDTILSPVSQEGAVGQGAQEVILKEKSKIDRKRERVKAEITKELEREMERKQAHESRKKSREDWSRILKERTDERAAEITRKQGEKAKHVGLLEQRCRDITKSEIKRRREMLQKFAETDERVSKQAEERRIQWANAQEDRRKKMADIIQRNLETKRSQEEESIKIWEASLEKEREREERVLRSHEEKLQRKRAQYSDKMAAVSARLQEEADMKLKTYNENMAKLMEAKQRGVERLEEVRERAKTAREKETTNWQKNRIRNVQDSREKMNKLKSELSDSHAKSIEVRERHFEDSVFKKAEMRGYLLELVEQNKARLDRADACAREQTLAKIRNTKEKTENHLEQRKEVLAYRTNALRDEMIGKTQLDELKAAVRDCPTKRINQLLKELDMPLLPTEPPKEGEEEASKQ